MATEGHRLHGCGRARQFDSWFLDMAMRRRDHEAVAERLLACVNDPGMSDDLLVARYDGYFRWLLGEIAGWRMDHARFTSGFTGNVKALAKGISFDDELKLWLDWAVSVKQYNMNVLDGNEDGYLSTEDLQRLITDPDEIDQMIQFGDIDLDGQISYVEFALLMNSS